MLKVWKPLSNNITTAFIGVDNSVEKLLRDVDKLKVLKSMVC